MPTNTYVALDKVTVGTATPSVTFTGISGAYTDLVVVLNTSTSSNSNLVFRLNNDSTSIYSNTALNGNGTSATSGRNSNTDKGYFDSDAYSANNFNYNATLHVMNYSNTTTFKTTLSRSNNAATGVTAGVTLYRSTSAINRLDILTTAGNFQTGSTFSLYGIAASSVGAKATGGTIYSDSQYYYHAFAGSGNFTPNQSLTCDYLVVAGGAGGGSQHGGGGGAGGLRSTVGATGGGGSLESAVTLASGTAYAVTVGAGGAGSTNINNRGSSGSNSSFIGGVVSITSTGGGGGGSRLTQTSGATGGSGGGGGYADVAGSGTTNQGYAGGNNNSPVYSTGGGGGGAGAVGQASQSGTLAGNGGIGVLVTGFTSATGTGVNNYYSGGGGGGSGTPGTPGTGGTGGGGAGSATSATGTAGVAYSGGGGGAGGFDGTAGNGGNGGSGVVIVRYLKA